MGAVTALHCVSKSMATILVDVTSRVMSSLVVDGADERGLFLSRGWLLVDRYLFFAMGRLIALFYGRSSTSRGRAFGLLNCCHLEQSLHIVSNVSCLGIRRLRHITQQHCRCHDVLARSREAADRLLRLFVSDDLPMDFSSSSADTSTGWVRQVLLKNLLEQDQALTIFVEFCLELSQLRKLRGSVFLRWWVDLSVVPRRPRVFPCCRGSTTRSGILRLVGSFYCLVDMIAFPSRVVAIGLGIGVWLGGIEISTSLFQQSLPEGSNRVTSRA